MRKNQDTPTVIMPNEDKFYEEIIKNNLDDRRIVLNDQVDNTVIENLCLYILKWNKEDKGKEIKDRKRIYIYVNSLGGEVITGLHACDLIRNSKTPITTVCLAYSYSMGGIIFSCGHERIMFKNSSILIHDGSMCLSGSAGKVKDLQKFYDKIDVKIKNIIVDNSKITSDEYDESIDRELYFLSDECKEKGLCDKIIGVDVSLEYIL